MASKIKGLQQWCARRTEGYRDVNVIDMSTSWRDGLAFCAIIHRFRPDLIDFDSLSKENIFENNQLAFEVAENELDIPAFLDAPDMVRMKKPDKLSIVTYVSQYYNYFNGKPELGGPGISKAGAKGSNSLKRPSNDKKHNLINSQDSNKSKTGTLGDKCAICDGKVYLMERHIDNNILYHRLCFRHSTMSPTNKVYNSPDDNTSNVSKVRKIDHKTNGDVGGRKSLFPEKTKANGASKTPSKYHAHALEFLSRENDSSISSSTPKQFTTSTPKSKYEDRTSLTIVPTSSATTSNSGLDNKSKYSSQLDKVQSSKSKEESKFSLTNKHSDKTFSDSVTPKTKETSKLFESTPSQPETPKSGLRDFLKKYHEQGEKENKSVSNSSKTFDKMEVDNVAPSPITRNKLQHNVANTKENSDVKSWRTETNGVKSPVLKHKFDTKNESSISDRYNGIKNSASSTTNGTGKHLDTNKTSVLNSYQSHLNKDKDTKSKSDKSSKVTDELVNRFSKTSDESRTKAFASDSKYKPKSDFATSTTKSDFASSKPKSELSVTKPKNDFSSSTPQSDIPSSKLKSDVTVTKISKFSDSSINKSADSSINKISKDILKPSNNIKSSIFDKKTETKSDSAISDLTKKKDASTSRYTDSSYLGSKHTETKKSTSPVPKPRGILKTSRLEEDMDTSESNISKTSLNLKPSATPRTVHNITSIKDDSKSTRPKSPVLSRLKLSSASASENTVKASPRDVTTPETPPPLPFSPPPSISIATPPTSPLERKTQIEIKSALSKPKRDLAKKSVDDVPPALPSRSYLSDKKSSSNVPPLPPRTDLKIASQETFVIGQNSSPGRPPRIPLDNKTRKETPMSIDEAIHKAMSPETSPEAVAVFVSPSPSSGGDQNILGGLLKSLAGVRQKSPPEVTVQQFDFNKQPGGLKTKLTDVKDQEPEVKLRRLKKETGHNPAPVLNMIKKKDPERPKSVHSILDSYNNNSKSEEVPSWKKPIDSRSSNRPKSVAMVTPIDDDVPSWRQNMELKKVRAKSATSVEDPNDFGKLTWQRDAAKRMAKNKHFVDPEFEKVPQKPTIEDKLKDKEPKLNDSQSSQLKDKRKLPETPFSPNPPAHVRKAPERPKSPVTYKGLKERSKSPVNIKKAPERPKSPPKYTKHHETPTDNGFRHYNDNKELDKKHQNNNKYRVYPETTQDNRAPDLPLRKIIPSMKFDFDNSTDLESSVESNNRNNNPTTTKLSSPKPPPLKIDISPKRYSPFEIRNDLIDIDKKLTELELRGRNLEDTIRNATTSEVEDELMTEWFKLINEKNELVRQEADLIYINREQELEDEQDSIDSRLRYLMSILDEDKTVDEREEEEDLINKKLDVINKRSSIVDSIDEDRIRYEEEDRDIAKVLYSKGYDISGEEQIKKVVEEESLSGKKKKKNKKYI